MTEQQLRTLAEQVKADLPALIPDERERAAVDQRLMRALAEPPRTAVAALTEALRSHEAICDRLEEDQDRIATPPGDPLGLLGVLYICPRNDYSIVRETPSDDVLLCPNDGSLLERFAG